MQIILFLFWLLVSQEMRIVYTGIKEILVVNLIGHKLWSGCICWSGQNTFVGIN